MFEGKGKVVFYCMSYHHECRNALAVYLILVILELCYPVASHLYIRNAIEYIEVQLFKRTRMCVHDAITRDANSVCFAEI